MSVDETTGEVPFDQEKDEPLWPSSKPPVSEADAFKQLLSQVNRDVIGWRPESGDTVYGTVVDMTEAESEYGSYPLLLIDSPEHPELVGVHCFHATLRNNIQEKIQHGRINLGTRIAISYRGEGTATTGKSAPNLYRVAIL